MFNVWPFFNVWLNWEGHGNEAAQVSIYTQTYIGTCSTVHTVSIGLWRVQLTTADLGMQFGQLVWPQSQWNEEVVSRGL